MEPYQAVCPKCGQHLVFFQDYYRMLVCINPNCKGHIEMLENDKGRKEDKLNGAIGEEMR